MRKDETALGVVILHREDAIQTDARVRAQPREQALAPGVLVMLSGEKTFLVELYLFVAGRALFLCEKKVEPGFVDVYGVDRAGRLVVVELKRRTAGRDAVLQLAKYVDYVKTIANRELRGVLVAPRLAKGAQAILTSLGLEFKALDPKKCAEILRRTESRKLADFF